jgi:hypothetical protein
MVLLVSFLFAIYISSTSFAWGADGLSVEPPVIELKGLGEQVQIRVLNTRGEDVTAGCVFKSHEASTVKVSSKGQVVSNKVGQTKIEVVNGITIQFVPVKISEADTGSKVTFEKDLQPILTRYGCNSGPCHGKQRGQNGFQLSLLGFDNDFDFYALTSESRGRRIFPASPKDSLLLKKASGQIPHGAGKSFLKMVMLMRKFWSGLKMANLEGHLMNSRLLILKSSPLKLKCSLELRFRLVF